MKQVIFSDNLEIQTILFLVTIIFVIKLTAYHFGNIWNYKFYFLENVNSCELNYT